MTSLADPEDLDEATKLINQYASSDWARFTYTNHAFDRQSGRIISNELVELALRQGMAVSFRKEIVNGRLRYKYKVRMVDTYGHVTVITAIAGPMHLVIVSTFTNVPD
jgi:hypothetical protein